MENILIPTCKNSFKYGEYELVITCSTDNHWDVPEISVELIGNNTSNYYPSIAEALTKIHAISLISELEVGHPVKVGTNIYLFKEFVDGLVVLTNPNRWEGTIEFSALYADWQPKQITIEYFVPRELYKMTEYNYRDDVSEIGYLIKKSHETNDYILCIRLVSVFSSPNLDTILAKVNDHIDQNRVKYG